MSEETPSIAAPEQNAIAETGSITARTSRGTIHCITIVGQIEGHMELPAQNKTTKYEHLIPQIAAVEQTDEIDGLLVLLNTVGGDVEAGLAIAELIAGMKKPTVSLVLGGGHSIGIPLAAGVFIPLGLTLNPMFGAAAMSLSSFCVVSNALRLNLFKLHDAGKDKKINRHSKHKEETTMVKTMKIEGMMCGHCEAAVKKALEAIDGVASAEVSHTDGTAVVTLSKPVENAALRKAVEDKDYTVTDIEG